MLGRGLECVSRWSGLFRVSLKLRTPICPQNSDYAQAVRRYGKILPTTDDCSDPDHWIELVEIYRLIRRKKNVMIFFSAHDVDPPKTPQKTPQMCPCASSGVPRLGYRRPSRRAAGAKIFGRAAPLAAHERLRLADARERRPRQHGGGHGGLEQQQGEEREEDDQ